MTHLDDVFARMPTDIRSMSDEELAHKAQEIERQLTKERAAEARSAWEHVEYERNDDYNSTITDRLKVPGGYLYRTRTCVVDASIMNFTTRGVAMVFVTSEEGDR